MFQPDLHFGIGQLCKLNARISEFRDEETNRAVRNLIVQVGGELKEAAVGLVGVKGICNEFQVEATQVATVVLGYGKFADFD